ncbi:phospho-sugar mutase, partial [Actinomadura soli]
ARRHRRTLLDLLDDQARRHGLHTTTQLSIRTDNPTQITTTMTRLRTTPPATLAGHTIETLDDLAHPTGGLPPTNALRFHLTGGARVIIRPSGTEPKLKCYLELVQPVTGDIPAARARATAELDTLRQALSTALS